MAGRSGLISDLLEFLEIHSPIRCGRHLDQVTKKTRHMKTGEPGLSHRTRLELRNFFARPLVTVFFRNAGAVRAFRFFECLFSQRAEEADRFRFRLKCYEVLEQHPRFPGRSRRKSRDCQADQSYPCHAS